MIPSETLKLKNGIQEVVSSILISSTIKIKGQRIDTLAFCISGNKKSRF